MTYTKPEVNVLGDAALVIQSGQKAFPPDVDDPLQGAIQPAYDLDE